MTIAIIFRKNYILHKKAFYCLNTFLLQSTEENTHLFVSIMVHKGVQTHIDRKQRETTGEPLGARELTIRGTGKGGQPQVIVR